MKLQPPPLELPDQPAKEYPGAAATAVQVLGLAHEYRKAAKLLMPGVTQGKPLSRAPCRFLAAHAIELYLNALLLHAGQKPETIRGLQHDLSARAEQAIAAGLKLRANIASHLSSMTRDREYLITRYSPDLPPTMPQVNRLMATLEELAEKVAAMMALPPKAKHA